MSIKNTLVLSSGGLKGISQIGALKYLHEKNILQNITTYAGTSVGGIICVLLIIGFTIDELYDFIMLFDMSKIKSVSIDNLYNNFGLDNGEKLLIVLKKMFEIKHINTNITFEELFHKTKKKLILTGVCLNDKKIEYFSYETHPKMQIILALRISSSIPLYFVPVHFNNKLYIDGACIDKYPIRLFDHNIDNVIGIYLHEIKNNHQEINNHEDFFMCTIQCLLEGVSKNSIIGYEKYTINITTPSINIFNFVLTSQLKQNLFIIGYQAAQTYFN
jgi:NTE family protein